MSYAYSVEPWGNCEAEGKAAMGEPKPRHPHQGHERLVPCAACAVRESTLRTYPRRRKFAADTVRCETLVFCLCCTRVSLAHLSKSEKNLRQPLFGAKLCFRHFSAPPSLKREVECWPGKRTRSVKCLGWHN